MVVRNDPALTRARAAMRPDERERFDHLVARRAEIRGQFRELAAELATVTDEAVALAQEALAR